MVGVVRGLARIARHPRSKPEAENTQVAASVFVTRDTNDRHPSRRCRAERARLEAIVPIPRVERIRGDAIVPESRIGGSIGKKYLGGEGLMRTHPPGWCAASRWISIVRDAHAAGRQNAAVRFRFDSEHAEPRVAIVDVHGEL